MALEVSWDKHEAAFLIEMYIKIESEEISITNAYAICHINYEIVQRRQAWILMIPSAMRTVSICA